MTVFFIVSFAWLFQSITGFGAGIFIIGLLSLFYEPKAVVVSSAVFNLLGTLGLLLQNRKGRIEPYLMLSLLLWSVPGIYLGAYLLDTIDSKSLKLLIALFIILLGLYDLLVQKKLLKLKLGRRAGPFMGFLGGLFAGLVGMGGPPPVVFLNQQLRDPQSIRLMLNLLFTSNILFRLIFYKGFDVVRLERGFLLLGLAGVLAGLLIGAFLSHFIKAKVYKGLVSYSVMFLGFLLLLFSLR